MSANATISDFLFVDATDKQREFTTKIAPDASLPFIGARMSACRGCAKRLLNTSFECTAEDFMQALPHTYTELNMVHMLLINEASTPDTWRAQMEQLLPHLSSWIETDACAPKILRLASTSRDDKNQILHTALDWLDAQEPQMVRTGIIVLMFAMRQGLFEWEHLEKISQLNHPAYYVQMAAGWYLATSYLFQKDATRSILEDGSALMPAIRRIALRKICESSAVTQADKTWARALMRT